MPKIIIPYKPVSTNRVERTGHKTNIRYKTQEARDFKTNVWKLLEENEDSFLPLLHHFDPYEHCVYLEYTFYFPHDEILTKPKSKKNPRRKLSRRAGDTNNYEKWTTDCIFSWLGVIDDVTITDTVLRKRPSVDSYSIHANIKLCNMVDIEEFSTYL